MEIGSDSALKLVLAEMARTLRAWGENTEPDEAALCFCTP